MTTPDSGGTLSRRLLVAAARHATRPAVYAGAGSWSYEEVWRDAFEVTRTLRAAGIGPGHRVGIWMEKSALSLRVLLGTLIAGAAYVPIDPRAPWRRALYIAADGEFSALAVDRLRRPLLDELLPELPPAARAPLILAEGEGPLSTGPFAPPDFDFDSGVRPEDPAYILYTSGSTGHPKGVVLSHRAALGFIDWCLATFELSPHDRMSSHAPFHFDLSTFDLFVTLCTGASVRLLSSTEAMLAPWLARKVREWGITVWYSVPSALITMLEQDEIATEGWPTARLVLFAGEVFPTPALRKLRRLVPAARWTNLYGPTETNVCTYYDVPDLPDSLLRPIPIGRVCEHLTGAILDDELSEVTPGTEGDLWIGGANLLTEYWKDREKTDARLRPDPRPGRSGLLYHTGDRVRLEADGDLAFLGRRDHMVKVRGYRVELGDIESALHEHPAVAEAAVVALPDARGGYVLYGFYAGPSTLAETELKSHLTERVPLYMVPDRLERIDALPRTSTGKLDRLALAERARG